MLLTQLFEAYTDKDATQKYRQATKPALLPISVDQNKQNIDLIKKHASDAFNKPLNQLIYKGFYGAAGQSIFSFTDTRKSERRSKNTTNYFTALTSILPSWKNWPKRTRSLSCTNSTTKATRYGKIYVILPFNGTKIAIASSNDIWSSFPKLGTTLNEFNQDLDRMINQGFNEIKVQFNDREVNSSTISLLCKALDHFFQQLLIHHRRYPFYNERYIERFPESTELITRLINGGKSLTVFNDLLNPVSNGNKLIDISNYYLKNNSNVDNGHEIWFEGRCFVVERDYYSHLKELDINNAP